MLLYILSNKLKFLWSHSFRLFLLLLYLLFYYSWFSLWINSNKVEIWLKYLFKFCYIFKIILKTLGSHKSLLRICSLDCTCCDFITVHKTDKTNNNSTHSPGRYPKFWMIITEISTDSLIWSKATIWCPHLNAWWLEWVVSWKA